MAVALATPTIIMPQPDFLCTAMDREQVEYFLGSYAKMSDEALAHLLVTRNGQLSEEAEHAMRHILNKRNPVVLRRAIEAIARDLNAEKGHAAQRAEMNKTSASVAQWMLRGICVFICLRGLFEMLNGERNAIFGLALGVICLIAVELRRLLRWVVGKMFNMR